MHAKYFRAIKTGGSARWGDFAQLEVGVYMNELQRWRCLGTKCSECEIRLFEFHANWLKVSKCLILLNIAFYIFQFEWKFGIYVYYTQNKWCEALISCFKNCRRCTATKPQIHHCLQAPNPYTFLGVSSCPST